MSDSVILTNCDIEARRDSLFEELLVLYVLEFFGLANTRTRFMLIDERRRWANDGRRQVTLQSFNAFFSTFPVLLSAVRLRAAQASRISAARLICDFPVTALCRAMEEFEDRSQAERTRALGVVCHWPHAKSVANCLVVHSLYPINANVRGGHMIWTADDGSKLVIESLWSLLQTIQTRDPARKWLESAARDDYSQPAD